MSPHKSRVPDILLGLGYAVLIGALLLGALAAYNQTFTKSVDVTLETGKLGNSLQTGSDVKLNGVPVGRVSEISSSDDGAKLTLALQPEIAKKLSPETVARLLPKTLFGERYVSLQQGFDGDGGLASGDVIREDSSAEAVELQEVFDELLPMLQAIKPDKLSAALGEMTLMLRGQGEDLGTMMVSWSKYFEKINPLVPQMTDSLGKFGEVADVYAEAAPDLLDAVESMATTSQMLVDENDNLTTVFASVISSANDVTGWMNENQQTIEVLSAESRNALEAVRPFANQFPCILRSANKFGPAMDKVLGKGTDEPGLHVKLSVVKSRGKYLAGKDAPTFPTEGKARCPYVTGDPAARGSSAGEELVAPSNIQTPPRRFSPEVLSAATGLGDANSPSENRLIAELVAPTLGMAPADYPQWSSLLLGPVLRGAKVSLQ